MKSSLVAMLAVIVVVACGTRDTRQKNQNADSTSPQGNFQGKPESDTAKACTPVDEKSAAIDKDLKKGDQFIQESVVSSAKTTIKTKLQTDIIETTATEVKYETTIVVGGGETLKNESTCKLVSDGTMECWNNGKEGETTKAKSFSADDMPCKMADDPKPKIEVFSGPFKMTGGQTVNAVRKVETRVGEIACTDGEKTLTVGRGTLVLDEYRSSELVNLPGKSKCQEELIFLVYKMTTDDGRNVSTMKMETTKAPVRTK